MNAVRSRRLGGLAAIVAAAVAMGLLRGGMSVTDACMTVGCTSLGSFSSRFTEIVGETPSAYRLREHRAVTAMPACVAKVRTRPSRNREAAREAAA